MIEQLPPSGGFLFALMGEQKVSLLNEAVRKALPAMRDSIELATAVTPHEREVFFSQLSRGVELLRDSFKAFMIEMKRYHVSEKDRESIFRGKGQVDELVERARKEGRLLWDDDDPMVRYWWTHGECNLVALMVRTFLVHNFDIPAQLCYVEDSESKNYHAIVHFVFQGEHYFCDGLMYSTNHEDIYRGTGVELKVSDVEYWKANLFVTDPCALVVFSTWCEIFKIDITKVIWDWEHPAMLSGSKDIDEYFALFNARYRVLEAFSIDGNKELAQAYRRCK